MTSSSSHPVPYPGQRPKGPRKPREPKPVKKRKPRPLKRRPTRTPRPLSSTSSLTGSRFGRTNGGLYSENPSIVSRFASFSQSAYVSGDRKNPNSHSYTSLRGTTWSGRYEIKWTPGPFQEGYGYMDGFLTNAGFRNVDLSDSSALDNVKRKASKKFYTALRDSDLNLAVDIAEWRQASQMIGDTGAKLLNMAMKCRKFSFFVWTIQKIVYENYGSRWSQPGARKLLRYIPRYHRGYYSGLDRTFAKTWLSYQYGWRPLMSTLYGLVEIQRNHAMRIRVRAQSKTTFTKLEVLSSTYGLQYTRKTTNVQQAQVQCDVSVDSSILNDVSRFTSLNPAVIAWELVPYSFVVDWFLDIGGYLGELEQSLEKGVGLRFLRGFTTDLQRTTVVNYMAPQTKVNAAQTVNILSDLRHTEVRTKKNRVRLTSLPWPFMPKFQVKLGSERILSLAALLVNAFYKFPNPGKRGVVFS